MEELLKTRPALPRRVSISGARRKRFGVNRGVTNLYEINEEEDFSIGPLPEDESQYSYPTINTPHS